MSKVIDLTEARAVRAAEKHQGPYWNVNALCLECFHRWIGGVLAETSLFQLQCPRCGAFNSFASFIPDDYLHAVAALAEREDDE